MKKQINPTIKAHLIRSAFYVLLLLAVCVIPFALAQRNTRKNATGSATTVALPGQLSTGGIPGVHAAPAATDNATSPGRHAKPGEIPTASYRALATPMFHLLRVPKLPNVTLYDQYNNAGTGATSSQDFEPANAAFSDFTADDFVVPSGQTWNVSEVDVQGTYDGFTGPAVAFHVFFYQDSGGLPGTQVYAAMNQPYTGGPTDFVINLSAPAVLPPGTYWVSVQCRMDFSVGGQWYWQDRTVTSNSPAAWQNPGGGFAVCLTWGMRTTCADDAGAPDQVYRLVGTTGGATPTPTPTPTATATATVTPTATPRPTPTPRPRPTPYPRP